MNAQPYLASVAKLLNKNRLEAILIGNAAAALQGAPVTTIDFDFLIRNTRSNQRKLKQLTADLEGTMFRPHYPASSLTRVMRDADGLQLDFCTVIDGVRSFEGLRSRATSESFEGELLLVASLEDIIKSKRAAGRPRDLAVLGVLEKTAQEKKTSYPGPATGSSEEGQ